MSKVSPAELRAHAIDIASHPKLGLSDEDMDWLRAEVYSFAMATKRAARKELIQKRARDLEKRRRRLLDDIL